ncbi:hypothetical protein AVEN_121137-1 [Araneus ventricosus]|uniref:Uncharacterized protein n=1 Tax=Araneus ventricosus TaxID=182803 RepID=A0A4Y2E101_ARAVE|nr:hypothetical protein AVEN_121137-1 [Araneus ventricosus]
MCAEFKLKARNQSVTVQEEHFLANGRNKNRFIQLTQKMTAKGIETSVAAGDADTYIVRCGLEKATFHHIVAIKRARRRPSRTTDCFGTTRK